MPQLDTVYMLTVYVWTWLTLYMMTQKIKTILITKQQKTKPHTKTKNPAPALPWT